MLQFGARFCLARMFEPMRDEWGRAFALRQAPEVGPEADLERGSQQLGPSTLLTGGQTGGHLACEWCLRSWMRWDVGWRHSLQGSLSQGWVRAVWDRSPGFGPGAEVGVEVEVEKANREGGLPDPTVEAEGADDEGGPGRRRRRRAAPLFVAR